MSRLIILGATGNLGSHVLSQALASGHECTVVVRDRSKLAKIEGATITTHQGDLNELSIDEVAKFIEKHDALICCAGHAEKSGDFINLFDKVVSAVESLPSQSQPSCWFLAGAALLDIGSTGTRGLDLPVVRKKYWPHSANYERLRNSGIDWRLLCPGPLVEQPMIGLSRIRVSIEELPVRLASISKLLPKLLLLPFFMHIIPAITVPYADAAALMLANLDRKSKMKGCRIGLALPEGMRLYKQA